MNTQTPDPQHQQDDNQPVKKETGPVFLIPKSYFFAVIGIILGSFAITFFVHNPYTQAIDGGDLYERSQGNSMMLWVAIFIGIPLSFVAYKRWILPLFDRK